METAGAVVAGITPLVAVRVHLGRVEDRRAVVAIPGVGTVAAEKGVVRQAVAVTVHRIVAGVADVSTPHVGVEGHHGAVAVDIRLVEVVILGAIVADIPDAVRVCIRLIRVGVE